MSEPHQEPATAIEGPAETWTVSPWHPKKIKDEPPKTDRSQECYPQNVDMVPTDSAAFRPGDSLDRPPSHKSESSAKPACTTPNYERNRPHTYPFWAKSEHKHDKECHQRGPQGTRSGPPKTGASTDDGPTSGACLDLYHW